MEPNTVFKIFHTLDISQMLVYRAIDKYNEISSVRDRKRSGHLRRVPMKKTIKALRETIQKNPVQ